MPERLKTGIHGFGRVGSLLSRQVFEVENLDLAAISSRFNKVDDFEQVKQQVAKILHFNVPYSSWPGHEIEISPRGVTVDQEEIAIEKEADIDQIRWSEKMPELVYASTGAFKSWSKLEPLFKDSSVRWIVLTCPPKNTSGEKPIPSVVMGVNHELLEEIDWTRPQIISSASCTTNCLAPIAKILDEEFEINRALMHTTHAVTRSQNLVHGPNKDSRLLAPADGSIQIYKTGADKALASVLPDLAPRFLEPTCHRVPPLSGSVLTLTAQVRKKVDVNRVNKAFIDASQGIFKGIVRTLTGVAEVQSSSSYCLGDPHSALVLTSATKVDSDWITIQAFYDNEWAYCQRLTDIGNAIHSLVY